MQWKERGPRYPLEHSRSTPSSAILGTLYFMSFLCHFQAMGTYGLGRGDTKGHHHSLCTSFDGIQLNSARNGVKSHWSFNISRGIICIMEWIKWNEICMQNSKIHCWTVSIFHYRTTPGNNRWCARLNQNSIVRTSMELRGSLVSEFTILPLTILEAFQSITIHRATRVNHS